MPAIVLQKCTNECPEKCVNDGHWTYRNHRSWPMLDINKRLNLKPPEITKEAKKGSIKIAKR